MRTTDEVTKFAKENGVCIRTAYRWVKRLKMEAEGKKPVPFNKPVNPYEFSKGEWV